MIRKSIEAASLVLILAVGASGAGATVSDLQGYVKAAGEIGVARSNCGFDMNVQKLLDVGRKFAINPADSALIDKAADDVAAGLARAEERYRAEGAAQFCRNMLAAYGPSGNVVPGVLKPR